MAENPERVRIGEFKVEGPGAVLKIFGLGSCVALALYDPVLRMGGLAHILLPGPSPAADANPRPADDSGQGKYADRMVKALVDAMIRAGCRLDRLEAKLAGGATMFAAADGFGDDSPVRPGLGARNVAAVRELLARLGLSVRAEDVGGSLGRTVSFETATGQMTVSHYRGSSKLL